ncbi:MAG TPA: isoprenylcysteine carboxylmethyltransferase family protein [Polyangiaceae bacterium]|nr:isoprenylcysteine carboxylmethyltransferase family protein [Polyangiaceae bacterium]
MNHGSDVPAYGLWGLVVVESLFFIAFAFSFTKPKTKRDWRTFGSFSAFIIALFVEMYGFPLTIYLLSGWLTRRLPGVNLLSHDMGHLWYDLLGFRGDPHSNPLHIFSEALIVGGFFLLSFSWNALYRAQKANKPATTGPYQYVRHPQYIGFIAIMSGFLLQWPTLITLVMFPILVVTYVRLAHREERETAATYGAIWEAYAAVTPRWFPRLGGPRGGQSRPKQHFASGS